MNFCNPKIQQIFEKNFNWNIASSINIFFWRVTLDRIIKKIDKHFFFSFHIIFFFSLSKPQKLSTRFQTATKINYKLAALSSFANVKRSRTFNISDVQETQSMTIGKNNFSVLTKKYFFHEIRNNLFITFFPWNYRKLKNFTKTRQNKTHWTRFRSQFHHKFTKKFQYKFQ